jgi:hypothetical protein
VSGWRDRLVERFFPDVVERRIQEALPAASSTGENDGFRRLTDSQRDLAPLTHDRQREIAVYLWTYNPLARRIINAMVEWVIGEGIQIHADDERTRDYLNRHWNDRQNRWDLRLEDKVRELYLMGEQFWPAFTNPHDGQMRLGLLDPGRVSRVILDPDNALLAIGVVTKGRGPGDERRFRTVLLPQEEEMLGPAALAEREGMQQGELFAFAVNKLSNQSRGISELFALADWLDGYEQLLFAQLNQERARSNFVWDVELTGATETDIKKKLETIKPPKPFSTRVHNEKEKWKLVGPETGTAANNSEAARLYRNHVLGGAAIPEHWVGGGGDVNRATAAEMGAPTEKSFTAKQRVIRYVLSDVLAMQIERGIAARALPDNDETRKFSLVMPDLNTRDISRVSTGLQQVTAGMVLARQQGWLSDDVAARVLTSMLTHLGVEADAEEMLDKGKEQLKQTLVEEAAHLMGREPAARPGASSEDEHRPRPAIGFRGGRP